MSNNSSCSTTSIADRKLRFETVILPALQGRPNAAFCQLNGSSDEEEIIKATRVAKPEPQKKGLRFVIVDDETKLMLIVSALSPKGQMIFTAYGPINDISIMVPCTITEWPQKIMTAIKLVRANIDITEKEVEELIK